MLRIRFNIPVAIAGQDPAFNVLWYQSDDGATWDIVAVDTEVVSSLVIEDGLYVWESTDAVPERWSFIKTSTEDDIESNTGLIFPPQSTPTSEYGAQKIDDGVALYKAGEKIELMLQVDISDVVLISGTVVVQIRDIFDNIIGQAPAEKIGEDLFAAEFTVPSNIADLYNINTVDDSDLDSSLYYLKDVWMFPNNTELSYPFFVSRIARDQAVIPESMFTVEIKGVNGTGINETISFISSLPKFYATIDAVRAYSPALNNVSDFAITGEIIKTSNEVDLFMRPNVIHLQETYDAAVRCYVSKKAAFDLMKEDIIGVASESKTLDSFSITRSYDSSKRFQALKDDMEGCALMVLAGGLDTPYMPQRFQKGLYDPNRPNVARANLDLNDKYPWVNFTTDRALILTDDGATVELRGTRTIATITHSGAGRRYDY